MLAYPSGTTTPLESRSVKWTVVVVSIETIATPVLKPYQKGVSHHGCYETAARRSWRHGSHTNTRNANPQQPIHCRTGGHLDRAGNEIFGSIGVEKTALLPGPMRKRAFVGNRD